MPYRSEAQRKYFNANRKKLEADGVDVDHWNETSKGKKLPETKSQPVKQSSAGDEVEKSSGASWRGAKGLAAILSRYAGRAPYGNESRLDVLARAKQLMLGEVNKDGLEVGTQLFPGLAKATQGGEKSPVQKFIMGRDAPIQEPESLYRVFHVKPNSTLAESNLGTMPEKGWIHYTPFAEWANAAGQHVDAGALSGVRRPTSQSAAIVSRAKPTSNTLYGNDYALESGKGNTFSNIAEKFDDDRGRMYDKSLRSSQIYEAVVPNNSKIDFGLLNTNKGSNVFNPGNVQSFNPKNENVLKGLLRESGRKMIEKQSDITRLAKVAAEKQFYNAAIEKLAALGGLQAAYVADAAGADASERASQLAGDRAREDEDLGLLDSLFGGAGDVSRMINNRKRHGAAAFAENDVARLLNVVDPSKLITDSPDQTLTGLAMVAGKKKKDREGRVLDEYEDIIKKYQDPVDMDGEKTTRETPWHLLMQGQQADVDTDVAGHKQQRKEHPLNYWLNPLDRTGPINELGDRFRRRMGASIARPDSALGRFGMGAGNVGTLGLLGVLAGGEDAQNKLRRSAVDNEIFDEHSMPEGAGKDGDGDGKVNDGTPEEKEAAEKKAVLKSLVLEKIAESAAWQRKAGKNSEGGLNAKGRASYNKSTGGNLKAPVTSKNPKGKAKGRKASFCARMSGMKKKNTSKATANDPDSRINKSLRKWNC